MTTATITKQITLSKAVEFTSEDPAAPLEFLTRTFPAGTVVNYERTETATQTVHTAWLIRDGVRWESIEYRAKQTQATPAVQPQRPAPAVPAVKAPAPVAQQTASVNRTTAAQTVMGTVNLINRRHVAGTDEMERRVNTLRSVSETLRGDVYMLIYDIPEALSSECPNPSRDFWRVGFRLNKSCWVMPQKGLDSHTVQNTLKHWESVPHTRVEVPGLPGYFRSVGVKVHVIKYAADQLATIRQIAADMLQEELIRIHTSLIQRIASADDRLREAQEALRQTELEGTSVSANDRERAEAARDNSARATLRDAMECFAAALKSAEAFDETDSLSDLFTAVRESIRAEALAFNARTKAAHRKQVKLTV